MATRYVSVDPQEVRLRMQCKRCGHVVAVAVGASNNRFVLSQCASCDMPWQEGFIWAGQVIEALGNMARQSENLKCIIGLEYPE